MAQLWRECKRCHSRRFLANRAGPPKTEIWDSCPDCPEPSGLTAIAATGLAWTAGEEEALQDTRRDK